MELTEHPRINELLAQVNTNIQETLKDNLIGIYLYGSATAGDFDPVLSDVDLLAVTKSEILDEDLVVLEKMHNKLTTENPNWKDRIEVVYINENDLKNFKKPEIRGAKIGPGEALHFIEIGKDWLINWYNVRQNSITLYGPNADAIIPFISQDEYKQSIKDKTLLWKEALDEYTPESTRGSVAYAVFTLCRSLYSMENGEQASKKKSAEWASTKFPEWKNLIDKATEWRKKQWRDNQEVGAELSNAIDFLKFAIDKVLKSSQ